MAKHFPGLLRRKPVGLDYYISMGGSAYGTLHDILYGRHGARGPAEVYAQLSTQFAGLVEVLGGIAARARNQDRDLVRIYERWERTGSARLHRQLMEHGLVHRPPEGVN